VPPPLHPPPPRPLLREQHIRRSSTASANSGAGAASFTPAVTPAQIAIAGRVSSADSTSITTVASAATAVSAAAAELGRSAFRRITAAGNQVKRGIAALAGVELDSTDDGFGLEGDQLPLDLHDASERRLHWLPSAILQQVGSQLHGNQRKPSIR
jgi:hypothetical protein